MKIKIYVLLLIFGISSLSYDHAIKMSASLIEYNPSDKNIRVECRVFIDDFGVVMKRVSSKHLDFRKLTKADKKEIEDYFNKFYIVSINGKKIPLHYKGSDIMEDVNVLTIEFSEVDMSLKKGDKLLIQNSLFFDEFSYRQTNHITIKFPPFIIERNCKTDMSDDSYSYTF